MKYRCLRDCYVNDRFFHKGDVVELPDEMRKSEKNFELVEGPVSEPESGEAEALPAPAPEPVKPDVIPPGQFWCGKCKALHRESGTSKIGKRHLQYKV